MAWTEERVAILKVLWAEGLSASQIATQLGAVTRNAVIGKVHRLGLAGRATPSHPATKNSPRKTQIRERKTAPTNYNRKSRATKSAPVTPSLDALPMANGEYATILTIRDHMCKWPIGDPTSNNFRFCGRKVTAKETYCKAHHVLAYQPNTRRTDISRMTALPKTRTQPHLK